MEVVGLTSDYRLTEAEWAELMAEEASQDHEQQTIRELPYLQVSRGVLAKKQQLLPRRDLLRVVLNQQDRQKSEGGKLRYIPLAQ